jgi:hypothetical protein
MFQGFLYGKINLLATKLKRHTPFCIVHSLRLKIHCYLTVLRLMAVACAAMLVPLRAFLKPSIPHDLSNFTSPVTENDYYNTINK